MLLIQPPSTFILPLDVIELCQLFYETGDMYRADMHWTISRLQLQSSSNKASASNARLKAPNFRLQAFKFHTSWILMETEMKPALEPVASDEYAVTLSMDVLSRDSCILREHHLILRGSHHSSKASWPWIDTDHLLECESITFRIKSRIPKRVSIETPIPNAAYRWVMREDNFLSMHLQNSETFICHSPQHFGFKDMFFLGFRNAMNYFKIHLYLPELPFTEGVYGLQIDRVKVLLEPNAINKSSIRRIWRASNIEITDGLYPAKT